MLSMAREGTELRRALELADLDLDFYIHRQRELDEILPWSHIDNGMKKDLLVAQYQKAENASEVPWPSHSSTTSATA